MQLKKYKLGELIDVRRGASLSGEYYATEGDLTRLTLGHFDYQEGGFKENTSKNDLYFVGPVKSEFILQEGDIITPLTEQTSGLLGSTAVIPESGKYIQSQDVALITPNEELLDRNFCYYLLPSKIVKQQLAAGAQQTKIRHTTPDRIKDLTVFIPSLTEQKTIGQLLKIIDRKIALNKEINRNLEAMARQLYDYWFVQFDFPDENGRPYKSSGGKMVWNEKLKREIPEGWNVKSLGDLAIFRNGINYSKEEIGKECAIVNVRNISACSFLLDGDEFEIVEISNGKEQNYYITNHDIIIARSGCPGATRLLWQPNNTLFCGFIICCSPKDIKHRFLITLHLKQLEGTCATQSGGSILQNVNQDTLKRVFISLPYEEDIIISFNRTIEDILSKLFLSMMEMKELQNQRDELLPLLMNGQVSVMPTELNCGG